jgi:four helix bundle protein
VRFAGEVYFFINELPSTYTAEYYKNQLTRSSGSSVLNYGEAQGTITDKDFRHKMSIVVKELKESRGCLKVLNYVKVGPAAKTNALLAECEELIAIGFALINKRK